MLLAQFGPLEEAMADLGVTVWPMVDLEADDALAAAAKVAAADPAVEQVVIMTPDKDLAQCVTGTRVVQLDRRSGVVSDEAGVKTKYGVLPPVDPRLAGAGRRLGRRLPRAQGLGEEGGGHRPQPLPPHRGHPRAPVALGRRRAGRQLAWPRRSNENRELALLFKDLATLRADAPVGDVEAMRWKGPTDRLERLAVDAAGSAARRTGERPATDSLSARHGPRVARPRRRPGQAARRGHARRVARRRWPASTPATR